MTAAGSTDHELVVWVLEDDPLDQRLIRSAFGNGGFPEPNIMLPTADQILVHLDDGASLPDLFIVDLNTPGVGGMELVRLLRQRKGLETAPIVILTSSDSERDRIEAAQSGANAYHVKPFDWREFNDLIAGLLGYWSTVVTRTKPRR
jgi:DNA-binding response OmpR family regulator